MQCRSHHSSGYAATLALVAMLALALGLAPTAFGDDWARDRAAATAVQELDPAIRIAMVGAAAAAPTTSIVATAPDGDDGFAWGAAALGLGAGVIAMCALLGCVTLVRSHGRLRSA
jgi:hypothetical protein